MTDPAFVIRPAGLADLEAVLALRGPAGPGFTSLAAHEDAIAARLAKSAASFAAAVAQPGPERYVLLLESLPSREVVGMAGLRALVGEIPPFFNFRVLRIAQSSLAAQRRFDMDVLIMMNEFAGCTEVGSLFVMPEHRAGGIGRALAQSRYLLTAIEPERFAEIIVSELRGVVDETGHSPFWEALGRYFFKMDFEAADRLSATTDNQFILDLMPKYPIYVDLLPQAARAVIGRCHPAGEGARRLLEWEGFHYANVVDVFDGGPLMSCARDTLRTAREAKRVPLKLDADLHDHRRCLVAVADVARFRCVPCRASPHDDHVAVTPATLDALEARDGDMALVWAAHP